MVPVSVDVQVELFAGLVYVLSTGRVRMPDGSLVDQKRFDVLFPGRYDSGDGKTSKAWFAFIRNQAYRCPVSVL